MANRIGDSPHFGNSAAYIEQRRVQAITRIAQEATPASIAQLIARAGDGDTETYYTRREVWHRLDAMLPDERNITVVTWDDPYGRRTDDGGFVYDALSREVEYGD